MTQNLTGRTTPPMTKKPNSTTKLANQIGISRSTLYGWRDEGAPLDKGAKAVLKWAADHGKELSDPKEIRAAMQIERLAILKANRARMERDNRVAAGEMMLTADARRQASEAMAATFGELERRDRELPPALAGLSAVEIFKRMNADTESIRKTLKSKFDGVAE